MNTTPKHTVEHWIPLPQGELLPAEERLANVLKAIETRLLDEQAIAHKMDDYDSVSDERVEKQRAFVAGLDIAWSIAQTEILRRTDSPW